MELAMPSRIARGLVCTAFLVCAGSATAGFPQSLEGGLHGLAPAPDAPLAQIAPGQEGTFRLEAAGENLLLSPGTATLLVPAGALRAVAREPYPVAYTELPAPLLGPVDWTFQWSTPPTLAAPWISPSGGVLPSELDAVRWNLQMLLLELAAAGVSDEPDDLDEEAALVEELWPSTGRFTCHRFVEGVGLVVLPGCRLPCDPAGAICGLEPIGPPVLSGNPTAALIGMVEAHTGLPVVADCADPTACIDLAWMTSALTLVSIDGTPEQTWPAWLWSRGGAYDVVHASGRLAAYAGWLLFALGPELDRTSLDGGFGMVFLLVPPLGHTPPNSGTPLLERVAPDGVLAGAYGSEAATSRCSGADGDADGMPDSCDNCSAVRNGLDAPAPGEQRDSDDDGFGNACDCDFDQNGRCGVEDIATFLTDLIAGRGDTTDMNGDDRVDISDFIYFVHGFLAGTPGPSGVAH